MNGRCSCKQLLQLFLCMFSFTSWKTLASHARRCLMFTCNEKHSTPLHCWRAGQADLAEVCPHIEHVPTWAHRTSSSSWPRFCSASLQDSAISCLFLHRAEGKIWLVLLSSVIAGAGHGATSLGVFYIFTRNTENILSVLLLTKTVCSDKQH